MITGFLSIKPKVWVEGETLHTHTSRFAQCLFLGAGSREMIADRAAKCFTVRHRFLWFFRTVRVVPFKRVEGIRYSYKGLPLALSSRDAEASALEVFSVSVIFREEDYHLSDRDELILCKFFGEGTVSVARSRSRHGHSRHYDTYGLNVDGDQSEASRDYVDLLCEFTGIKTIP